MSLSESQRRVDAWISQFEEGYFDPLTNLARLTEEVGELAREINHRFGQKTKKHGRARGRSRHGDGRHPLRADLHGQPGRASICRGVRPDDGEGGEPGSGAVDAESGAVNGEGRRGEGTPCTYGSRYSHSFGAPPAPPAAPVALVPVRRDRAPAPPPRGSGSPARCGGGSRRSGTRRGRAGTRGSSRPARAARCPRGPPR